MVWLWPMRMACLVARMFSAVVCMATNRLTIELSCPAFDDWVCAVGAVSVVTLLLVATIFAQDVFLHLSAIASCRYSFLASSANAFVAHACAIVLATAQSLATNLSARPASIVVRLRAAICDFVLAAEANLCWPHMRAGRTRSSVASQTTRMWTLLCLLL